MCYAKYIKKNILYFYKIYKINNKCSGFDVFQYRH